MLVHLPAKGAPMADRVRVAIVATDPVSRSGVRSQLRGRHTLEVADDDDAAAADVALIVVNEIDDRAVCLVRSTHLRGCRRVVIVATDLDETGVLLATGAGASGMLRRADATPERLVATISAAAAGDGALPPDLLGRLLEQVGRLQRQVLAPRGLTISGLTEREVRVLRLLADGCDTSEIAGELAYSERTVKNVIHDITSRLHLRNRSHAVAYALRQGLI
jgi:DNA-binding NarL/FixJ family response regulator